MLEETTSSTRGEEPSSLALALVLIRRPFYQYTLALTLAFGFFGWIQFSVTGLAGFDGYYHARMAALMLDHFFLPFRFDSLSMTILSEADFADHHYLFHALMAPFTALGDPMVMVKLAAVVFATAMAGTFFFLLRRFGVRWPWFWFVLLGAASEPFLYRMSLLRAQSLGAILLLLGCWLTLGRYRWGLFAVGFIFAWTYAAFPMLGGVVALTVLGAALAEGKWNLDPIWFAGAGMLAGMLIHPYMLDYARFVIVHASSKLIGGFPVRVGNEWYPFETDHLLSSSWIALTCFLAGLGFARASDERNRTARYALALVSVLFFVLFLKHRRFSEYWPLFSVLLAAVAVGARPFPWAGYRKAVSMTAALVLAGFFAWSTGRAAIDELQGEGIDRPALEAAGWFRENTGPGERVFNADWDDFPVLFYAAPENTFIVGLDPLFMYLKDPELYDRYVDVTRTGNRAADVIRNDFQSRLVFVTNDHGNLIRALNSDPEAEEAFRSACCTIFRLN